MVTMRTDADFSESERTILHQLFGDQKHKIQLVPKPTPTVTEEQLRVKTKHQVGKDQNDLLQCLHLQATFIEE